MRKSLVIALIVVGVSLFIVGCLDYKAYNIPKEESKDDASLVDEIASVEKQLNAPKPEEKKSEQNTQNTTQKEQVEEIVLPELSEKGTVQVPKDTPVLTVKENDLVKLKIKANDQDNDKITYTFTSPLNNQGLWKTSYGDAGEYLVTVKASDGKVTTEKAVKIIVKRVNMLPVIENLRNLNVKEGDKVTISPRVTDPNHDKVTVTISEPLQTGSWQTDHKSSGEYQVTVKASDGELESEKSFALTVADVNVPPKISGIEDITVKEGETVRIKPVATDEDHDDNVSVTISDPVGNDGIWQTTYTDHGVYPLTITATDGKDKVTKMIRVTIEDVNVPPDISDVLLETS